MVVITPVGSGVSERVRDASTKMYCSSKLWTKIGRTAFLLTTPAKCQRVVVFATLSRRLSGYRNPAARRQNSPGKCRRSHFLPRRRLLMHNIALWSCCSFCAAGSMSGIVSLWMCIGSEGSGEGQAQAAATSTADATSALRVAKRSQVFLQQRQT